MNKSNISSWKELLENEMNERGETLSDLESITLTKAEMEKRFDTDFGSIRGKPFTAWSPKAVYFPVCYDGAEWVGSVSRYPDGKPTRHQGG